MTLTVATHEDDTMTVFISLTREDTLAIAEGRTRVQNLKGSIRAVIVGGAGDAEAVAAVRLKAERDGVELEVIL
jgi:hypothetical protein